MSKKDNRRKQIDRSDGFPPANDAGTPRLTIVIITHEREHLFAKAFRSVKTEISALSEPVVLRVYNSSRKSVSGSMDSAGEEFHVPAHVSAAAKRRIALDECSTEWIVFVDDDCEVTGDAFRVIADYTRSVDSSSVAAYFCVTKFVGPKGFWFRCLEGTDYLTDFDESRHGQELPWGPTALSAFHVITARSAGGFDSEIGVPAGGEDVDLCLKLRRDGYQLIGIPQELVIHTTETWNTFRANFNRSCNYGRAEFELLCRWPGYRRWDPGSPLMSALGFLLLWVPLNTARTTVLGILACSLLLTIALFMAEMVCERRKYSKDVLELAGLSLLRWGYRIGYWLRALRRGQLRRLVQRFDWYYAWSFERERGRVLSVDLGIRWGFALAVLLVTACLS
jgi:hypothetical protein